MWVTIAGIDGHAMAHSAAGDMKLVGGDPCLDFVNTVGGRIETREAYSVRADKLTGYPDLLAWSQHAGLLDGATAHRLIGMAHRRPRQAARVFARAVRLREALHRTLVSLMESRPPEPADLRTVNGELAAVRSHDSLVPGPDGLRWEPDPARGTRLDSVLWPVGRAAAGLLTSGDLARLRRCAGEECGWLFLDHSRNRSRQWCSMKDCGNLSKVRRFRQRLRREG